MPKNLHTRSASPNRSRSKARAKRSLKGRTGRSDQQTNRSEVVADSIHTLNLVAKPGVEVVLQICGGLPWYVGEDLEQLYSDLLACYKRAMKQKGLTCSNLDMVAAGIPKHLAVASLIQQFERDLLPKGFSYNIDHDEYGNAGYFFTVYMNTDLPQFCNIIEIKPIVLHLSNDVVKLNIFFEFLKCVHIHLGFSCWWETHDWAIEHIEQRLMDQESVDDEDWDHDDIMEDMLLIDEYRHGMAKMVQNSITKAKLLSPQRLLSKIDASGFNCKITRMMKKVLAFMVSNSYSILQYEYIIPEDFAGVRLDWQFDIIWSRTDGLTDFHNQVIDDEYNNGGTYPMIYYFQLTKKSNYPEKEEITRRLRFPGLLDKMLTDSILFL